MYKLEDSKMFSWKSVKGKLEHKKIIGCFQTIRKTELGSYYKQRFTSANGIFLVSKITRI